MNMIEGHMAIEAPENVPVWDVDPYDHDILRDPFAYYSELRSRGPFVYIPKYAILATGRYPEAREVFTDWERFVSSRGVGLQDFKLEEPWRPPSVVLEVDPPYHTKTRNVIARALSPKAIRALKDSFQQAADRLIDELLIKGTSEMVVELAEAYTTTVFPAAVGLSETDSRRLVDYGAMVFNALGPDNELRRKAMAQGPDIVPWITERCKRENLSADGIGATIYAAADEDEITLEEAGMLVRSLLSAGVDTTVTGIGSMIWCFATYPEQFDILKADPKLARPAFEEILRFTSPVHSFFRTVNVDTEVSGVKIVDGTKIMCSLGAANRDEQQFPEPDKFDIKRMPAGHLAMGQGIHGCVGQVIARAEVEAVSTALANKVGGIEFAGEAIWRPNHSIRALDTLPVTFHGKQS
ncbi:MAG: cytochrome P450 [Alphaproteobacteria bacterium]|jgi:4-methoxybenzoate monooxygenase (O-demethylating)|nr:cytochrome P450 [Alphaproteobacteria bacterium]MBT4086478.1 cytochrome P450 [Alphaproteobacteria bacterium]MBT4546458.1 cytochrome P450 [Alphaproteobacteria bacterium]MBT7745459.1 cytochrome P450 [Alphaproteobacteria bacterium]